MSDVSVGDNRNFLPAPHGGLPPQPRSVDRNGSPICVENLPGLTRVASWGHEISLLLSEHGPESGSHPDAKGKVDV